VIAEEELAGDLGVYRRRIDTWADKYRAQGWPQNTPRYLLRPYGRLLATSGDLQRLIALATDPARHDRMLVYTQGDAAASLRYHNPAAPLGPASSRHHGAGTLGSDA
jgi:hypothetical protein